VPLSWIWIGVDQLKRRRARPFDPGTPVICVGNLTLGGTGKTPVVRALLKRLRSQGVTAVGLTRGYGGRLKGPLQVDPLRHDGADVGDEPLLLAADAPVWISRNRAAGAAAAVAAGARVIVMDDGHQNPTLRKTLSLIVADADTRNGERPFGDGRVFPAGPLREPLREGLSRADAVVLMLPNDLDHPDPALIRLFGDLPILIARLSPLAAPPAGPQLGFAGVGKPWKVEQALKAAGCRLVDFAPFPDHHAYTRADLRFLADRAATLGAGLVTTEKDWMRLPKAWRVRVSAWPVEARFADEAGLDRLLRPLLGPESTARSGGLT
jgi:tetraacyldisaccharide 4'-kinase